jgi:N-acetylmuramoyl-L-alanine amidase
MLKIKKIRNYVLVAFVVFAAGGCATVSEQPIAISPREAYLKEICAANDINWQWDSVSQVATLLHRGARADVLVGSDIVLLGKERIKLSSPVRTVRSAVIVPADFQSKVISRLLKEAGQGIAYETTKPFKIIIDAGHGGKDPGAIGFNGAQEKGIVLDISKRLKKILSGKGYKITMTRDRDEFISLQERTAIASRANVDLFISVHANSSPVRSVQGLEVYIAEDMSLKDRDEDQRKINHTLLFKELAIKKGSTDVEKIVADMMYTHKQQEANKLAGDLATQTVKSLKTKNRGVKSSRFFVVRNTLVPAILVEVGFLTNPKEAGLLEDGVYRQKIAQALSESIEDYVKAR